MNILATASLLTVALNACLAFYLPMNKAEVFPGDSVLLPCNSSGFPKDELHWEAMGKHVAVLHEGNLTAGQGYEDRVFLEDPTASEDVSLVLTDVMFNDGGIYECLWRGQEPVCSVFVDVLKPLDFPVFAAVGETVTLLCYGNIPPYNPWEDIDIRWLKDEREVLRFTSGEIDVNVDNSRMSLPVREEISRGIFSLTITSIRFRDEGVYRCRYKSTGHEDAQNGLPETQTVTVLDVSSEVSSTIGSIPSASNSSSAQSSSSVPTWTDAASTGWSSPVSTHSHEERTETEVISTASAQTSAHTIKNVSSTVESIPSASNSSLNHTSSSLPTWAVFASTESASPVSTHSYVERTETEVISTASAQTSAAVSSTIGSIPSASNSSSAQSSSSVPTWTDAASTGWSSPVSTHSHEERTETEVISTASAHTIKNVSSTVESIPSASNSSLNHTSSSVPTWAVFASTESASPVSTHSYVERTETEAISTASAQTSAHTVEEFTDVTPILETGTAFGRYVSLELLLDEKIPWILIGLIGGVLLITAGVLTSLMLVTKH